MSSAEVIPWLQLWEHNPNRRLSSVGDLWGLFFFFFLFEAYASFDTMVYLSLHLRYKGGAPSISFASWCQSRILYVTSLCCSRLWLHSRHKSCNRARGLERYEPLWGSYLPRLSLITSCTKYACGGFFSRWYFYLISSWWLILFTFINQFTDKLIDNRPFWVSFRFRKPAQSHVHGWEYIININSLVPHHTVFFFYMLLKGLVKIRESSWFWWTSELTFSYSTKIVISPHFL